MLEYTGRVEFIRDAYNLFIREFIRVSIAENRKRSFWRLRDYKIRLSLVRLKQPQRLFLNTGELLFRFLETVNFYYGTLKLVRN